MPSVWLLTLEKVCVLFTCIALGYLLRRSKALPENTGQVLSKCITLVFCPAYTVLNFSRNFTVDKISRNLTLVVIGCVVIALSLVLARVLGRLMGRDPFERKTLTYAFAIPNYGYFGYPVVESVFGAAALGDMMAFCMPFSVVTNTYGYLLFAADGKLNWKRVLLSPLLLSLLAGAALGLSGVPLPGFVTGILSSAGGCMSPCSMLLVGFVLGQLPIGKLLSGWRSYFHCAVRLLVIPAVFTGALFALGLRGMTLLIPGLVLSLPLGLNLVVFPQSQGYDCSRNAQMCFVSYLLALPVLPVTFSMLQSLAALP